MLIAVAIAMYVIIDGFDLYRVLRDLEDGRHARPFFQSIGLFLLGYLGLAVSLFPCNARPSLSIWQTANTVSSQLFTLVGFAIAMPITFIYTAYGYYVFRGKVADEVKGGRYGYH